MGNGCGSFKVRRPFIVTAKLVRWSGDLTVKWGADAVTQRQLAG